MDGRVLLPLLVSALLAGCTTTNAPKLGGIKPVDSVGPLAPQPEATPPHMPSAVKKKDAPKRQPSAEFIVSLAVIAEEEGKRKKKGAPEQFIKQLDETRRLYQEALKVDPDYAKAQQGLVRVYTQLGEHHKAQDVVRKALEKKPTDGRLWLELGMTYNRQKNYEEALRAFRKAREFDPENRQYIQAIGFTLVWTGRLHEGLDNLTVALGKSGAHYNVAGILRQQDRLDEARQHLQICLDADPNFERARDMLAQMDPNRPVPAAPGADVLPAGGLAPRGVIPTAGPAVAPSPAPGGVLPALDFVPLR